MKKNTNPEIILAKRLGIDYSRMGIEMRRKLIFEKALARIEELEEFAKDMEAIIDDSAGVSGYHLNGLIADWDEFKLNIPALDG